MMEVITSYEPYSQQPEYIQGNRDFLENLSLGKFVRVLDLACGTGTLTEILFEIQPNIQVIGIDISKESLDIGRKNFRERGLLVEDINGLEVAAQANKGAVLLLEGSADEIPCQPNSIDLVVMGNSIHLLPDKDKLLQGILRVLRPGGRFAFNSTFFVGTYPEGTQWINNEWMKESFKVMLELDKQQREKGEPGIKRKRGTVGKAFDKGWMSSEEWQETLSRNGFEGVSSALRTIMMTQQSFETVGAYAGLAEVLMSGYPIQFASQALQEGAKNLWEREKLTEIPRYWLEITGIKPA